MSNKIRPWENPAYDNTEDTHTSVDLKDDEFAEDDAEKNEVVVDHWNVDSLQQDYIPWGDLTKKQKRLRVVSYIIKFILILGFLYLFICSLDFLSSAFKLLGGKKAGEVFHQSKLLTNPVAGLMMGVLVTVLVQSSSTSTSIVISMVAAKILTVQTAVPIVMGANIGTSVTNTLVSFGQITNKADFRRAFAGATVHDMFNLMNVAVMLPVEMVSSFLYHTSGAIVDSMHLNERLDVNQDFLKTITKPFTNLIVQLRRRRITKHFTNLIVQVSSSDIKKIATKAKKAEDATLIKFCCDKVKPEKCCTNTLGSLDFYEEKIGASYTTMQKRTLCRNVDSCVLKEYEAGDAKFEECVSRPWGDTTITVKYDVNTLNCTRLAGKAQEIECCSKELKAAAFYSNYSADATSAQQGSLCSAVNTNCYTGSDVQTTCLSSWINGRTEEGLGEVFNCTDWTKNVERDCNKPCEFLFRSTHTSQGGPLSDESIGGIVLVISLALLCICLVCIVNLLQSLLKGPMATLIKKFVNADFPGFCGYFTGYLAILIGAGMTILVQSSSIFTSTLTPLVGLGVIHLDRMYPLTLGSNIGTTATGVLAALAQSVDSIPRALQVSLCHLFFNIFGILLFYPFPFFRPPIKAAKFLGNTTAEYRWFAIVYLITVFFIIPVCVFALSIPGWYVLVSVLVPILLIAIIVGLINCIQTKKPSCLPSKLRTWEFMPLPLRSLKPYDRLMRKLCFCKRFQ
ncbi:hypothetical protein ACOMHN_044956 [Nucella lapillus]